MRCNLLQLGIIAGLVNSLMIGCKPDANEAKGQPNQAAAKAADISLDALRAEVEAAGKLVISKELDEAQARKALDTAFKHVAYHPEETEIRKYAPGQGISNITISRRAEDAGGIWVLIERIDPATRGGLNIRVDEKTGQVGTIKHWGEAMPPE